MGNWDRSLGAAPLLSSKLTHIISGASLANSFRHFNLSYADTGLWGVHIVTENVRPIFLFSFFPFDPRQSPELVSSSLRSLTLPFSPPLLLPFLPPSRSQLMNIDDTVHFTLKEWQRMSMNPTGAEVERAKSQLKAATLLSLSDEGTKSIVEDIAKNIFTHGTRLTPKEIEAAIDGVTVEDIMRV